MVRFKIPCAHDTGEADPSVKVSDHHPLSKEEIKSLIDSAKSNPGRYANQVQIRLGQGIVGMTCPRPIEGPVAQKQGELDRLFLDHYRKGGTPGLVEMLYETMNQ